MKPLSHDATTINKSNTKGKAMSSEKFRWARRQKTGSGSANAVLKSLAYFANEDLLAYPSINTIADDTELDRKTVVAALDRLLAQSLISDSGLRAGHTKNIIVYRLNVVIDEDLNSTNIGIVINETVPLLPVNSPVFTSKQSQNWATEEIYNNNINNNPPIVPPRGDERLSLEPIAPQVTLEPAQNPAPAKPKRKKGEITQSTEEAMKALINECDCKGVPKGYLLSYLKYRHSVTKKPIKSTQGLQAQINVLAELPDESAMHAAIKHTMDHEWMKIVVPERISKSSAGKPKLVMPNFGYNIGDGREVVRWAKANGIRDAKDGETAQAYYAYVKTAVERLNAEGL